MTCSLPTPLYLRPSSGSGTSLEPVFQSQSRFRHVTEEVREHCRFKNTIRQKPHLVRRREARGARPEERNAAGGDRAGRDQPAANYWISGVIAERHHGQPMPLGESPCRYSRNLVSLSGSQPGVGAFTSTTKGSLPIWSKLWGTPLGIAMRSPGPTSRCSSPSRAFAFPRTT